MKTKKRIVSMVMSLLLCFQMTSVFAHAQTNVADNSDAEWVEVEILSEVEQDDGSIIVTIVDEEGVKELVFYPQTGTQTLAMSWAGWGSPSTVYYDATLEQEICKLTSNILAAILSSKFGGTAAAASETAKSLINNSPIGLRTIWLGRTIWLKNDYSAYRRQDTYYSDSRHSSVVLKEAIREYIGGN